ncbi:MAG: hypothetical protein IKR21_03475 [Oscillospiraceae bacterium]|nr:hypothetical protein [Oscillospiraceae bacterium]
MNRNDLFRSLNDVDDAVLERSEETIQKKRPPAWLKWGAAAACLAIVVFVGYNAVISGVFSANGGSGGREGMTYMSYAGPVFPLSAMEEAPEIEAERSVDYDFSPYISTAKTYETIENGVSQTRSYEGYRSESIVTDSYTLKNTSGEDKTMTLIYPFAARLSGDKAEKPMITVSGVPVETKLHIGPYSGSFTGAYGGEDNGETFNLSELSSWEDCRALIEAGYMSSAFDELPELNQPAVVYELKDRYGNRSERAASTTPELRMEFNIDYDKTTVFSYGFNYFSNDYEAGLCALGTWVPHPEHPDYGQSAYIIVLGEDLGHYTLTAYTNGSQKKVLEDAGATVLRYECVLGEIFEKLAGVYLENYDSVVYGEDANLLSTLSKEEFAALASEYLYDYGLLNESPKDRYAHGSLEDIFSETRSVGRIMYLTFEATVPAGGSLTVTAEMEKPASMDYFGGKGTPYRNGYDMVTQLGSVLSFTKQTASVSNTEAIEIIRQSFGFDLENGVTKVELDMAEPHYYIDVQKKAGGQ